MNTKLIIWILGIFLGVIIIAVLWYAIFAPKQISQTTQPNTDFPVSESIIPTSSSSDVSSQFTQTMTLSTQNGEVIVTNNFIQNGITIQDKANAGRYLLAGNLGYCLSDPRQCQAGSATNFNIYFESALQSFVIALTEEPVGQARLEMEQFMLTTLGVTQQQMCSLNYYVGVTSYLNPQFAGKNLGFSFCPGATVLPR